jgi:uncharacterized Zn finger protein (UPF0148 family)
MRLFARRSQRDQDHLAHTLRSLGSTSVAGLSAALSWSERRTERAIKDAVRRGYGAIRFDPARRSISWNAPVAPTPALPPAAPLSESTPAPVIEAPALPKSWGTSARCPACQVAYLPTGTPGHSYCPQCGRLATVRASPARGAAPGSPSPTPATSSPSGPGTSVAMGPDRRSQELFAAWVTAQPIPCPKCRTPLRHHGVAEYACPSCGARVAFERSAAVPASTVPVAAGTPTASAINIAPSAR